MLNLLRAIKHFGFSCNSTFFPSKPDGLSSSCGFILSSLQLRKLSAGSH